MPTSNSALLTSQSSLTTTTNDIQNKLNTVNPLSSDPSKLSSSLGLNHKDNLLNTSPSVHEIPSLTPPLTPPHTYMNSTTKSLNNYFDDTLLSSNVHSNSLLNSKVHINSSTINSNLTTPINSSLSNDLKNNDKEEICIFTQVSTTIASVQSSPSSSTTVVSFQNSPPLKSFKRIPSFSSFSPIPSIKFPFSSDQNISNSSHLEIDTYSESSNSSQLKNQNSNPLNSMLFDGILVTDYASENPKRNKEFHCIFKSIPDDEYLLNGK
ncbi:453_t:CDS:1 [Scutellospora calospora]|uniref:453_t:CDS:1 n=1 Tax=Scutellospora calospora TaxID=85575 RepID=A0ACA9KFZ1_9GLOM|nr:453_t:CDS:1 [Scutellospora calospora]